MHTFAKCPLLWHLKHTAFLAGHMLLAWIDRPQKVHNLLTLDVASDTLSVVEGVDDLSATFDFEQNKATFDLKTLAEKSILVKKSNLD